MEILVSGENFNLLVCEKSRDGFGESQGPWIPFRRRDRATGAPCPEYPAQGTPAGLRDQEFFFSRVIRSFRPFRVSTV